MRVGRLTVGMAVVLLLVSVLATSAMADHAYIEISIPIDTVVRGEEGSVTELAVAEVPDGVGDHSCEVTAHAENQKSVHPGNDLLIESGTSAVTLSDVEAEEGAVTETHEALLLSETITVSLVMGPDRIFSAGIDVIVECIPEETTTSLATTTTAEVSDTEVTTTLEQTTTTVAESTTTAAVSDTEVTTTQPSTTSSIEEVLGTEVLPFTGAQSGQVALVAIGLVAMGALLVANGRRARD